MKNFQNKKVVISGGGSGIGNAIINELYHKGTRDFAVIGRNVDKLKRLENDFPEAIFLLFQGDISKPNSIHEFVNVISNSWNTVDVLINNAGVVSAGSLESISDDDIVAQININVTGLILLTKHVLPLLKMSKEAAIVNVSSGLGLIGMPFYASYSATKGGVRLFSEAIRRELKDFPIQVITVYPTVTATPMMESAKTDAMDTPDLVAQQTIEGLQNNKIDVILGGDQRLEDVKKNINDPKEFDKKAATMYEALLERTSNHRSM
ncbi:SDR family NAD(P)-dependent oxidoreductase [Confluentibacter flavum]|uniref:Short-chain dehydrogenase n=1 Tax=Confluentibacter flavum TaxID=1909700 RepID=A0A2N3HIK9_9FLAO|nr:SDR family NAD(P)-dependent oxidoreductase [Confluentibacter flavum]PKQ44722.1 short-chain dehydrogenase [Confluentibacter flavum]